MTLAKIGVSPVAAVYDRRGQRTSRWPFSNFGAHRAPLQGLLKLLAAWILSHAIFMVAQESRLCLKTIL